jgi:hypothetical protein
VVFRSAFDLRQISPRYAPAGVFLLMMHARVFIRVLVRVFIRVLPSIS